MCRVTISSAIVNVFKNKIKILNQYFNSTVSNTHSLVTSLFVTIKCCKDIYNYEK